MINGLKGQFIFEYMSWPHFLDILLNNLRNQSHRYIPARINSCHRETDLILLSGEPVIVAAMGDCIDADMKVGENSVFVDVSDRFGIYALNLALASIILVFIITTYMGI